MNRRVRRSGDHPRRGDIVWLDFNPRRGHEQVGRRPALVLSANRFNSATGMLIACPITNQVKGYPLEVQLPEALQTTGVILAHQVKALDWQAREIRVVEAAPAELVDEVLSVLVTLLKADE